MAGPSLAALAALPWTTGWVDRLWPDLLYAAAGSVAILALVGTASLPMRRASAAARHEAWLLGFAGALLLPVLSATLPAWHVLPRPGFAVGIAGKTAATAIPVPARAPAVSDAASLAPTALAPRPAIDAGTAVSATAPEAPAQLPTQPTTVLPALEQPVVISSTTTTTSRSAQAPAGVAAEPRFSWKSWMMLCWATGALLVLARVLLGHVSLWSLRRRRTGGVTRVTGGELFDTLERLRKEVGLRRRVELLTSRDRTVPMTWGLWRGRLLVPEEAAAHWSAAHRRDVLLHELGHLRRWDCQTQLLSQIACAVYWFNPLAWFAARRMLIERERACDDLVLGYGAEAPAYARHLLQSVSSSVPALRLAAAAVAMARPSTLEERMRAILDNRLNRRAVTMRCSGLMILLLLAMLLPAAVLKAQVEPEDAPPPQPQRPPTERTQSPGSASREGREGPTTSRPAPYGRSGGATGSAGGGSYSGSGGTGGGGFSGSGGTGGGGFSSSGSTGGGGYPGGGGTAPRFGGRGGFGGGGFGGSGPALGEGPTCTFDVTIYDVRLPVEQIGKLDVDALANASQTAEAFEKALAALGTARPMYRVNQSVRLSGDTVNIGSEVPMVTNTRLTDKGQSINSVQYQNVGAIFRIAGQSEGGEGVDLDLSIEVSSSSDTGTAISDKVNAILMRRSTMSHKGPVKPKKPFVIVSVDANSVDKDGKAVACIGRITLGEPRDSRPPREPAGR